jgi:kynureninase
MTDRSYGVGHSLAGNRGCAGCAMLTPSSMTRSDCAARDAADPLAPLRSTFAMAPLDERGVIYLDGNSLGVLPVSTASRLQRVAAEEWGIGAVRSWNDAGWIDLAPRVAQKIAQVIGAGSGEVVVADSTSINLYKVLHAAVAIARANDPQRSVLLSESGNFPTDLYIASSVARGQGLELALVGADEITARLDNRTAIVLLTHVNYRTGRMHDLRATTRAAHAAGAVIVWDLAHTAGVVPIEISHAAAQETADFAVGCGYKFLNGGPGAPAFLWARPVHAARLDRHGWKPPLAGWLGHARPFDFSADYQPAPGMKRFQCGTPPILSLAALDCGVDTVLDAEAFGGLRAIRDKSVALTSLCIELFEQRCGRHGLEVVTPRAAAERRSQVSCTIGGDGYAIVQALIARGVIGDFRAPDILRFGFSPLYTRFVDVWDAVDRLDQVLVSGEWRDPRFSVRAPVT